MSSYTAIIKGVVSKVTGIPQDKLGEDTVIPVEHHMDVLMRTTIETGAAMLFHERRGLTIGKITEEVDRFYAR